MKSLMTQIFSALSRQLSFLNVRSVLSLALAGIVLLITTACTPSSPSASGSGSYYEKTGQNTELYDTIQPRQGGMNNYDDTDPRR
jgi:hypothetical protein